MRIKKSPGPERLTRSIPVTSPPFRSGTTLSATKTSLILNAGGIGDYINWITPIRYAIRSNPHIHGYIFTQPYFADLARLWLANYDPRFVLHVVETDDFARLPLVQNTVVIIPRRDQFASANSHNLFELGFIYYNQISHIPAGWNFLPEIFGTEVDTTRFALPRPYVVITPNATASNRRLTAECLNGLIAYIRGRGFTPILLGKGNLAGDYSAKADTGLTDEVIDLRDVTTLTEAACIMAEASLVIGLDNGLLHLASCTRVPTAWIFTTVEPRLRLPPRPFPALTVSITPPDTLTCRFCQSRMRYVIGHDFKNCLYGDNLCVKDLKASHIIKALEGVWEKI